MMDVIAMRDFTSKFKLKETVSNLSSYLLLFVIEYRRNITTITLFIGDSSVISIQIFILNLRRTIDVRLSVVTLK